MEKKDLLSLTRLEIEELLIHMGEKKFRGKQIFEWVNKGVKSFNEMTNLSKALRDKLEQHTYITNRIYTWIFIYRRARGTICRC